VLSIDADDVVENKRRFARVLERQMGSHGVNGRGHVPRRPRIGLSLTRWDSL
jgi:hypothetical protein